MTMQSRSRLTDKCFYGVYEGIVTAVEDESMDSTREGRVKIKLPWFDEQTELECRTCQIYAGNGYGALFIPEKGDEVLVAFIQGDMRVPVVLGGLYNGADKSPSYRASDKNEKMIRTKAGHQIVLDDTSESEKIVIVDKSGNNSIELHTKNDTLTITAKTGKLMLSAKEIEIKADAQMSIQAGSTLNIKGATINLN